MKFPLFEKIFNTFLDGKTKRDATKKLAKDSPSSLKVNKMFFGKNKILDLSFALPNKKEKILLSDIKSLQEINQNILTNLRCKDTAQAIVDTITFVLGYTVGTLFWVDTKNDLIFPYTQTSKYLSKLEKIYGKKLRDHKASIKEYRDSNLVIRSIFDHKSYLGTDLRDFVSPILSENRALIIQKLFEMKLFISHPLIINNKVVGILLFVSKREKLENRERIILKLFSDQMAIAVYNSKIYGELQIQLSRYQEKTQDMQSLLSLSQTSSSGPEIETNIQAMMDIVPEKLGYLEILGAVLVRYDEKIGKVYAYITTESDLVQRVKKILSKPALNDYAVFVAKDGENSRNLTLTSQSILSGEIKRGENLADFVSPPLERSKAWLMQKMMGGKSFVAVPINIRGEKLGAVIFMFRKQLTQIGDRDIDILKAFSQQIGVIIENLQFYQSLNKNIEELIRTKDNLEEILNMKNEFLRIVSHQLRTPLTAVRGLISMWKDGDFDNLASVKMSEVKTRVANNVERLNNIINDMIKAMESEGDMKLKFAPTDIEELIKDNIEILKSNFERKGLYIKYKKFGEYIPEIEADRNSLPYVFINLIDNAEKYTEKGGLEITVYREEDNVYVRFFDTGVGLSDKDKETLFKKFSRGQDSGRLNPGGSGLGLFIVKQILDEHHGKIQVSSLGRGKGATFVVSLPIKQPKPDLRI